MLFFRRNPFKSSALPFVLFKSTSAKVSISKGNNLYRYLCSYFLTLVSKGTFLSELSPSTEAKLELRKYIQMGQLIRNNNSTELFRIENLIKNLDQSEIVKSGVKDYTQCPGLSEFFIALSAPSMTGKTQLAFSVEAKLPLYFALSSAQEIYKNFENLTESLEEFATNDVNRFKKELNVSSTEPISMKLLSKPTKFQFETLGFLYELMRDTKMKMDISQWMEYFSNRFVNPKKKIKPMSILEFKSNPNYLEMIKKYYLFIDEFSFSPEFIFLRNLCRKLRLTCILASTNAKVANLIGTSFRAGSRGDLPSLWSVVIPTLPPSPTVVIEQFGIAEKLVNLVDPLNLNENERMIKFSRYINEQCVKSRPGLTNCILESIEYIGKSSHKEIEISVEDVFTKIVQELTNQISLRKSSAFGEKEGINSNLRLLNGDLFDSKYDEESSEPVDDSHMIDSHFFSLKNPHYQDKEPFLLFRKFKSPNPYIIRKSLPQIQYSFQSYFDLSEELLLLACLIADVPSTTSAAFFQSNTKLPVGYSRNLKAKSKSGNFLEVLTLTGVIESSHYTDKELKGTFTGVPLDNFIRNFLRNLDKDCGLERRKREPLKLKYGNELVEFMSSVKVPFLFPANNKWPIIYDELFSPDKSTFRLGTYNRTSNTSEIDAHFDIFGESGDKRVGIVECKNRAALLYINQHVINLNKSLKFQPNAILHLTLCKSCADFDKSRKNNFKLFSSFVKSEQISVYRLSSSATDEFELVPVSIGAESKLISIIIETDIAQKAFQYFD